MNEKLRNQQIFRWCRHGMSLFVLYLTMFHSEAIAYAKPHRESLQVNTPTAMLEDWRFSPEASQLEITLTAASQPHYFYLSQPSRLVIDLPDTKLGYVPSRQNYSGSIQSIRVSQLKAGTTRIVMDLAPGTIFNPHQVQLQPVSWQNPTRWVLRPLITSTRAYNASRDPSQFNDDLPPTIYNPPQPPNNLPPAIYNPPQPPNNLPPVLTSEPLRNLSPATNDNAQQFPNNLPPNVYNPQNPPENPPATTRLPSLITLPPTTNNLEQQPFIRVPPLTSNNSSQLPDAVLPPANFPNQPNINGVSPSPTANFPVPNIPHYSPSSPNSRVVEFGQPLTNPNP